MGDSQSMHSYRAGDANDGNAAGTEDEVSLRSLPVSSMQPSQQQGGQQNATTSTTTASQLIPGGAAAVSGGRSLSPVGSGSMSGDELSVSHGGRRSQRRRPLLDKQVNSLLFLSFDGIFQ